MKNHVYLLLSAVLLHSATAPLSAQVGLIDAHVDIEVGWTGSGFAFHWHTEPGVFEDTEFAPGAAYGIVEAHHFAPRPAGAQWDFLGVAAGEPIWFAPQSQQPGKLYLGLAAGEVPSGIFNNNDLSIRLIGLSGPGHFSLWQTDFFGTPMPFWTSANGLDATDVFLLKAGSHHHFNWGFTAIGVYTLTLEASGLIGGMPVTAVDQFQFAVGAPIPEPATYAALLGALALALTVWRRRRRSAFPISQP